MGEYMTEEFDAYSLHALEVRTLLAFNNADTPVMGYEKIREITGMDPAGIRRAVEWLKTRNALEIVVEKERKFISIAEGGREYAVKGIPELRIYKHALNQETMADLKKAEDLDPEEIGPAIGALKKAGIIRFGPGGKLVVNENSDMSSFQNIQDQINKYAQLDSVALEEIPVEERTELAAQLGRVEFTPVPASDRKLIESLSRKRGKSKGIFKIRTCTYRIFKLTDQGRKILNAVLEKGITGTEESQVLPDHLKDGKWRSITYRRYSLDLNPPRMVTGKRNPYREFLDYIKIKLLSLGFEEMVGDHVQPEFWNMDALYMPQFHSARDIHDAYFVKEPTHAKRIDEPYFSNVADTHTNGGNSGSRGWGYTFDKRRTRHLVLRSQTTALSARWLHKAKVPGKYFAAARCFRYDDVDATHAPDFFQIEGIVLSETNSFRNLLGLLKLFAKEIANTEELRFVPGYFPFTEPSVEAHIKHPKLGWIEMGGAGIFRPEVTIPQNVSVPVIAWGLGIDRMAMVAMGINDIRDLFATDLNRIRATRANFER